MRTFKTARWRAGAAATATSLALGLAACGSSSSGTTGGSASPGGSSAGGTSATFVVWDPYPQFDATSDPAALDRVRRAVDARLGALAV